MNCPACGADNAPGSKFCISCGSAMEAPQTETVTAAIPVFDVAPTVPVISVMESTIPVTESTVPVMESTIPVIPVTESTVPVSGVATAEPEAAPKLDVKEITTKLTQTLKPVGSKLKALWANQKVRMGILGGALALIVLVVLCSLLGNGNGFIKTQENIRYIQSAKGEYSILVGKKVLKNKIESKEGIDYMSSSLDGKVAAILTEEGQLYVVKGSKLISVAENVTGFKISVSGNGIAYATQSEKEDTATLYLAKVNGKSTEICGKLGSSYAISPDGKSVAYLEDGGDLMLFKGKKSVSICDEKNIRLYGLSNNGKQIYIRISDEDENILYSYNSKGKKTKLGSIDGSLYYNDDHTQVMFENEDGKTYIATKGKEAIKACSDSLDLVIAPGSASMGTTYPVSNLYGHVYESGDNEAHLIKKNKDIKLVSKATNMQLDGSAEYLYYCYDSEEIRYIKISQGEKASEKAKTVVEEYTGFAITSDRKYLYYSDGKDGLMCVNAKKGGTARQVADDVDFSAGLACSAENVVYYVIDDDLYAVSNGKKGRKVLSDVDSVVSSKNGYVYASNDDALFVSTGSKKPKKVLDLDF